MAYRLFPSYYEVLGVAQRASSQDIKRSYRRKALECHPDQDSSLGAKQRFMAINEAYQVLSDPIQRHQYDLLLKKMESGNQPMESTIDPDLFYQQQYESYQNSDPGHAQATVEPEQEFSEAYYKAKKSQRRARDMEYNRFTRIFRFLGIGIFLFGLTLGIDFLLIKEFGPYEVKRTALVFSSGIQMAEIGTSSGDVLLEGGLLQVVRPGDQLRFWRSPIYGIVNWVQLDINWTPRRRDLIQRTHSSLSALPDLGAPFRAKPGVFNMFSPVWVVMTLIAGLVVLFPAKSPERRFQIGLLMGFFALLSIYFTYIS